ncbi:MAG: hypothetical protein M3P85_11810 [Actinomycetota bacterium]|nr:hypothetical protein [Actinomycetota bacterium]
MMPQGDVVAHQGPVVDSQSLIPFSIDVLLYDYRDGHRRRRSGHDVLAAGSLPAPEQGAARACDDVWMPPALAPVIAAFTSAARERFEDTGWRKRSGEIYTLDHGDFVGWLGLNRATKYEPMMLNPVVGVRHQPTEAVVSACMGTQPHAYVPPTISSPIGYLRLGRHLEVAVQGVDDAVRAAGELADLFSAMRSRSSRATSRSMRSSMPYQIVPSRQAPRSIGCRSFSGWLATLNALALSSRPLSRSGGNGWTRRRISFAPSPRLLRSG